MNVNTICLDFSLYAAYGVDAEGLRSLLHIPQGVSQSKNTEPGESTTFIQAVRSPSLSLGGNVTSLSWVACLLSTQS